MSTINKPVLIVNGNPVGDVSQYAEEDSVSVTSNGSKTFSAILDELYSKIDLTKITKNTTIDYNYGNIYFIGSIDRLKFSYINQDASQVSTYLIQLKSSGSLFYQSNDLASQTTFSDRSSEVVPAGRPFVLYYGNKNLAVDLQTHANKCMYSNGEPVEKASSYTYVASGTTNPTIPDITKYKNITLALQISPTTARLFNIYTLPVDIFKQQRFWVNTTWDSGSVEIVYSTDTSLTIQWNNWSGIGWGLAVILSN